MTFCTASMKKIEKNLDETHANSKETVSVSNTAASAFSMSQCGVKWRNLNVSDFAEKMCDYVNNDEKNVDDPTMDDEEDANVMIENEAFACVINN